MSSCLDVVPDETRLWKPEMAPQAMVMNRKGTTLGEPSGTSLTNGATIRFPPTAIPTRMTNSAMNSWWELM